MTATTTPTKVGTLKFPAHASTTTARIGTGALDDPGQAGGRRVFERLAGLLAERYIALAYDARGTPRSTLDFPSSDQRIDVFADDASRLLAVVDTAPAYVLGCSGGATVGLELVTRHPRQVHALVAHEPPVGALLPDPAGWRAVNREVYDACQRRNRRRDADIRAGHRPRWRRLRTHGARDRAAPRVPDRTTRIHGNLDFFFGQMYQSDRVRRSRQYGRALKDRAELSSQSEGEEAARP